MFNLPGSDKDSGSYVDLLNRMTQRVRQAKVPGRILEIMKQALEQELGKEKIVLSQPEKRRLLKQVTQAVLTDVLGDLDKEGKA